MTNLEKLIETLQNAPIENTACFIEMNAFDECEFCVFKEQECREFEDCGQGIKQWLESEVEE